MVILAVHGVVEGLRCTWETRRVPTVAYPVRDLALATPTDVPLAWHRTMPELAFAANSISLLMPYVEPFIAKTMRRVSGDLPEPLRTRTEEFARQELSHHRQHRSFNDQLAEQCPGIRRLERWMRWAYGWIAAKRSTAFCVAFVAGSEAGAFSIARWIDRHVATLFDEADPEVAALFLWHLAEEVEHKAAAHDVFEAAGGGRFRYAAATALSMSMLMFFTFAGCAVMLRQSRRLHLPVAWFRLTRWAVSLAFTLLPMLASSCLPSHDPRTLSDPSYLVQWLRGLDARRARPAAG
jgi:predicted metal-dependent hydrolase